MRATFMKYFILLVSVITVIFMVACNQPTTQPTKVETTVSNASFNQLVDQYFDGLNKFYPSNATYQGIHDFDTQLEDYSQESVARRVKFFKEYDQKFTAVEATKLNANDAADE